MIPYNLFVLTPAGRWTVLSSHSDENQAVGAAKVKGPGRYRVRQAGGPLLRALAIGAEGVVTLESGASLDS